MSSRGEMFSTYCRNCSSTQEWRLLTKCFDYFFCFGWKRYRWTVRLEESSLKGRQTTAETAVGRLVPAWMEVESRCV